MQHEHAETVRDSPLSNGDLAPTTPERRTWGTCRDGPGGAYWFSSGDNWRALVAVAAGALPVLPGFPHAATTEGRVIADPGFLDQLSRYGVFVAFGLAAVTYVALSAARRSEPATARALAE